MPTRTEDIEEIEHKIAAEYGCKVEHSGLQRASVRVRIYGKLPEFHVEIFRLIAPDKVDTAFAWMYPDVQRNRDEPREVIIRIKSAKNDSPLEAVTQWATEKFLI